MEFPPKLSCRSRVNFESLYGIWLFFPSLKACITLLKAVRLVLIFFASSRAFPSEPVFETFSLPAKSAKVNFADLA